MNIHVNPAISVKKPGYQAFDPHFFGHFIVQIGMTWKPQILYLEMFVVSENGALCLPVTGHCIGDWKI